MRPIQTILVWLVFLPAMLWSQSPTSLEVYPVRVGHKWGYVKIYPNQTRIVIPPKYDYIGDVNLLWNTTEREKKASPFRLFEADGKVGLLDEYLQEVVPNQYNRIRALTPALFAVETDSLFRLATLDGSVLMDSLLFDDICHAHDHYFFTKKGTRWGVTRQDGEEVLQHEFVDIRTAGHPGYYKFKRQYGQRGWNLIDTNGRVLLKDLYTDLLVLDEKMIAVRETRWQLKIRKGRELETLPQAPADYQIVQKLNKYITVAVPADTLVAQVWQVPSQRIANTFDLIEMTTKVTLPPERRFNPWFAAVSEEYAAYRNRMSNNNVNVRVIGKDGLIASPLDFAELAATEKANVLLARRRYWGILIDQGSGLEYNNLEAESIDPFVGNIALYKSHTKYGAIGVSNNQLDTLPGLYDYARVKENAQVLLHIGRDEVRYSLSPEGQFVQDTIIFMNSRRAVRANKRFKEADEASGPMIDDEDAPPYRVYSQQGYLNLSSKSATIRIAEQAAVPLPEQPAFYGPEKDMQLSLPGRQVRPEETFCLEVNGKNYRNATRLEITLAFDPDVLHFDTLNGQGFRADRPVLIDHLQAGRVRLSWTGLRWPKADLPLFQLCFTAVGKSGAISPVDLEGTLQTKGVRTEQRGEQVAVFQVGATAPKTIFGAPEEEIIPPLFTFNSQQRIAGISEILAQRLYGIWEERNPVVSDFSKEFVSGHLRRVRVLSPYREKWSEEELIGFRNFAAGQRYTAVIDSKGQMALMDREGNILPDRYTYIGPFVAGRARVCLGGKLVVKEKGLPLLRIGARSALIHEFNLSPVGKAINFRNAAGDIFLEDTPEHPAQWGFINTQGQLIIQTDADLVRDFDQADSTALILRKNARYHQWAAKKEKELEVVTRYADFGLINMDGEVLIEPQYTRIVREHKYYHIAVDSTPTIYYNRRGHQIFINPTKLYPFTEGLAKYQDDEGRWGYVNTVGDTIIHPQFLNARPFSEGRALVVDTSGFCSFIDTSGTIIFRTPFTKAQRHLIGDFHNGRCWFKELELKGWVWSCYQPNGEIAFSRRVIYQPTSSAKVDQPGNLDPLRPLPMDFQQGVASVEILDEARKVMATLIDTLGQPVFTPGKYAQIGSVDEAGRAVITAQGGLQGLIDANGKVLVEPAYKRILPYRNGFAKVVSPNGKMGLIDHQGKRKLPAVYAAIGRFSEGLVAVKKDMRDGWHFVDATNRTRIPGPFKKAESFQNGIALVTGDRGTYFIDREGNPVFIPSGSPQNFSEGIMGLKGGKSNYFFADQSGNNVFGRTFTSITEFKQGVAIVSEKKARGRKGAINQRGVMIVPTKYGHLHQQPDGNIIVNPQRFIGLANKDGQVLIEPQYDRIVHLQGDIFRVEQGERVGYMRLEGGKAVEVWPLQF